MPDIQILASASQAAPKDYVLPGSQHFLPKVCRARFDGTGAGGSFQPTLEVISDAGVVVAEIPCQTTVAAGDTALCTFAPFLRSDHAASSGAAVIAWGILQGSGAAQNVPAYPAAGFSTDLDLSGGSFGQDGSGVFAFDPLFPNNIECAAVPATGWFVVHVQFDVTTSVDPIDVTAVYTNPYIEDPPGSGSSPTEGQPVRGYVSPRVDSIDGTSTWTAITTEPNEGFSSPLGFGLSAINYDALGRTLVVRDPKIVVTLIGA